MAVATFYNNPKQIKHYYHNPNASDAKSLHSCAVIYALGSTIFTNTVNLNHSCLIDV